MLITKGTAHHLKFNEFFEVDDDFRSLNGAYRLGDRINVGGNAAVYECTDEKGTIRAVKFLLNINKNSQMRFNQEITVLQKVDHPHIIKYIDKGIIAAKSKKDNCDVSIPYIIMEKADMNIVDYMKNTDPVSYKIYAPQVRGLADALSHLHQFAIHRDIKPENILVRGETWLLGDFGLCTAVEDDDRIDVTRPQERIGPKYWLSPEATDKVYFGLNNIDETSDIYQLCAVFWFIITRRYPLGIIDDDDYCDYNSQICREILRSLKYRKDKRPQTAKELYRIMYDATINKEV